MGYKPAYSTPSADKLHEGVTLMFGFKGLRRAFVRSLTAEKRAKLWDYYADQWAIANDNVLTRPHARPSWLPKSVEGPMPKWQRRKRSKGGER